MAGSGEGPRRGANERGGEQAGSGVRGRAVGKRCARRGRRRRRHGRLHNVWRGRSPSGEERAGDGVAGSVGGVRPVDAHGDEEPQARVGQLRRDRRHVRRAAVAGGNDVPRRGAPVSAAQRGPDPVHHHREAGRRLAQEGRRGKRGPGGLQRSRRLEGRQQPHGGDAHVGGLGRPRGRPRHRCQLQHCDAVGVVQRGGRQSRGGARESGSAVPTVRRAVQEGCRGGAGKDVQAEQRAARARGGRVCVEARSLDAQRRSGGRSELCRGRGARGGVGQRGEGGVRGGGEAACLEGPAGRGPRLGLVGRAHRDAHPGWGAAAHGHGASEQAAPGDKVARRGLGSRAAAA
mmetsp:Transcript_4095/g.17143  ORF Transcript_4095/g.17143 Transcript_4095/m.17143 type:complete len:346 (-) Transcript_4095:1261-2298(-)